MVDVITRQQIEQSGASNIVEFLDSVPGMSVNRLYGRSGIDASVDVGYMGESGSQNVLILVDGQRVNGLDSSGTRFAQIPMSSIERIEIRKASGGALFGDRAQGGVINIITRTDNKKEINLGTGSFGYRKADSYLGFKSGTVSGGVSLMSARSQGYRAHSDSRQESAQFRATHSSEIGRLTWVARGFEETANLPGSLTLTEYAQDPRQISSSYAPRTHRTGTSLGLKFDRSFKDTDLFTVDFLQQTSRDESAGSFYGSYFSSAITNKRSSFSPQYSIKFGAGQLVLGGEFSNAQANTDGGMQVGRTSQSVYLQALQPIGNTLTLDAGLRTQHVQSEFQKTSAAEQTQASDRKNGFSLGLKARISDTAFVRAGALTGFRFANADELYLFNRSTFAMLEINPNLRPMSTKELFLQAERTFGAGKLEAHYRHINTHDEIAYLRECGSVGPTPASCNANLYETSRSILSVSSQLFLSQSLLLRFSADFVDATISSGKFAGKRVPLTPREVLRLGAEKRFENFTLMASSNYRGDLVQASDQAGSNPRIPARHLIDLGVRAQISKSVSMSAWVRNLTNKNYYDYASANGIYPADARSLYLNFKATL